MCFEIVYSGNVAKEEDHAIRFATQEEAEEMCAWLNSRVEDPAPDNCWFVYHSPVQKNRGNNFTPVWKVELTHNEEWVANKVTMMYLTPYPSHHCWLNHIDEGRTKSIEIYATSPDRDVAVEQAKEFVERLADQGVLPQYMTTAA